ncbi:magnesium-translocating P-type ATPase [Oceaniglobus roseus]|uniref:magnesium-translocating P-type ATPase n=1 Tax=Oceaniglobus roseus TaxID=1737570 RepID=UPI000C7F28A4|nr:magnesium-translocating P-type ATPase [Kandeliimicrobium roseum]
MGEAAEAWWSRPVATLFADLGSGPQGLPQALAAARLAEVGANRTAAREGHSALRLLARQYESPLVLILVFAAAVSVLVREWTEAGIILAIVAASTLLGFAQEYRASASVAALRARLALTVRVLRDGAAATVAAEAGVPGDIVLLATGNLVPADGVVIEARDFLVTEAALTGESLPVEKRPGLSAPDAAISARANAVFQGTSVRSGTARMLALRTGARTTYAGIAARAMARPADSGFEQGIRGFGLLLTRVMTVVVTLVLAANLVLGRPLIESLLFSVALAVGLTPELLPAIISVTMADGARRLARRGAIVRRTVAIENLGAVDVLCTDKTGTLTTGAVILADALDPEGAPSQAVMVAALLNAALETGIDNPLDAAILAAGQARGLAVPERAKIDEIPYDFLRRRLSIVVGQDGAPGHLMITKGAFAEVLECCTTVENGSGPATLDPGTRERLAGRAADWGQDGQRVLALATRVLDARPHYTVEDERGMTFAGFLLFDDPLKPGIAEVLGRIAALGITTRIITGDNRHVARHVARAVGLPDTVLTGEDLNRTRDEALWHLAETTHVFAEVDPQQKERIVRALQRRGHAVAYLGDGINDAPALWQADVGVSVDQAVDVARESADIVLLDRDLGILAGAIVDGRRTFANTLKYISITTSANFGNMISMAIGTVFLPFLPMRPAQILLNNFLSDLPALALAGDRVDPEAVAQAPRWNMAAIRNFMVVFGLLSTAFDLLTFGLLAFVLHAGEGLFQTAWFLISLLTELAVLLVLRTRRPLLQSRPAAAVLWLSAAVAGAAVVLTLTRPLAAAFGLVPPPLPVWLAGGAIVGAYLAATEVLKRAWFRAGPVRTAGR